jgi:aspartyl-tRNA(Asn)/glutamyl-tRNA(Gln) amidotransferase subunit A
MEFKNLTIEKVRKYLLELGIENFYKEYLKWLKEKDKEINGFIFFTEDLAQKLIEKLKNKNEKLPLWGVPIAIKDNILVKGERCTAASKILENYVATYNATVIEKILEAGGIIVGKTNMDEFAMGSSTENSAYFKNFKCI